ncbi:hypothetical protein F66182_8105 [Fusarium sp. NRRL 66182]|nr:hypothetical protein F66182_8105 [Fusarium sp. NRRL 66182]
MAIKAKRPQDMPTAVTCEYQPQQEICPMLGGCPNIDTCASWFGTFFWGYGDPENEGLEVKSFRERVAQDKYHELEEKFRREYFAKQPVLPREQAVSFWNMARGPLLPDSDSSVRSSEEEENVAEVPQAHLQVREYMPKTIFGQDSQEQLDEPGDENANEEEWARIDGSEIDPEELFFVDVIHDEDESDEAKGIAPPKSPAKTRGEEYEDLVAPIWTWFFTMMDIGHDGDFYE